MSTVSTRGPLPRWKRALLERLYRSYRGHWLFRLLIARWDGGELHSAFWRQLLHKYHAVDVGAHSYGPVMLRGRMPRGTRIGAWCSVGRDLIVRRRNHPIDRVTQHPFFYSAALGIVDRETIPHDVDNPLLIGNDVWIGDRVMILSECHNVGNGAVLAGGSIVTRDVPAYAIVAGSPARILRYRFSPEVQRILEESRWWELDLAALAMLKSMLIEPLDEATATTFAKRCSELREG